MPCRICEDPPAAGVDVKQRGTEVENLPVSLVEVRDVKIQMELLRARGVRPPRRPVVLHPLEREYETRASVKSREAIGDRPSAIGLVDRATEERPVELREFQDIRAVHHHALQIADH